MKAFADFLRPIASTTGEQAWRFWTVPARGEPVPTRGRASVDLEKGGGATWLTGTYDAETDTLFWPTGNPYPDTDGSERQGDNLYTNSILALDAKTGKLRWHYQFTPHDLWDWDAQEPPVLVDAVFQGRPRKLLLQANRNGFFYVLDRVGWESAAGAAVRAEAHLGQRHRPGRTSAAGGRQHTGRERRDDLPGDTRRNELDVHVVQPRDAALLRDGGRELFRLSQHDVRRRPRPWRGTARSRRRRAGAHAGSRARCAAASPFGLPGGGFNRGGPGGGGTMALRALDLDTGRIAWEIPQIGNSNNYAGTLSTAGGVVFYGQASGEFAAVDAKSGAHLWHFETQETWKASPMTYSVNGRQYVAITSGANVLAFALPRG